jgi:hypothetical protein
MLGGFVIVKDNVNRAAAGAFELPHGRFQVVEGLLAEFSCDCYSLAIVSSRGAYEFLCHYSCD